MRIGTFAAGIAVGVAATLLASLVGQLLHNIPRPLIFATLPNDTREIAAAVDQAVKTRFPPGSSEDSLIAELSAMGFQVRLGERGLWADYSAGGPGCVENFLVAWSAGPDRSIDGASGDYHLSCL